MNHGFTLLELLVVVAILALLATIALSNYHDAQVRAKVARVKADMKTVATALESYAADQGRFPDASLSRLSHPTRLGLVSNEYARAAMALLSTPVAYLTTSHLLDPFATSRQESLEPGLPWEEPPFVLGYLNAASMLEPMPGAAKGLTSLRDGMVPQEWIDAEKERFLAHRWILQSVGPDTLNFCRTGSGTGLNAQNFPNAFAALTHRQSTQYIYDPSNGTVSVGDITLTAKGFLK